MINFVTGYAQEALKEMMTNAVFVWFKTTAMCLAFFIFITFIYQCIKVTEERKRFK